MTGLLLYVFCEFASFGNVGLIRFMRVLKTSFTHVARGVHLETPRVAVPNAPLCASGCKRYGTWVVGLRVSVKGEKDSSVHSAFELDSFGSGHGTMKICVERLDTFPSGREFSLNEDCVNVYIAWQCFVW